MLRVFTVGATAFALSASPVLAQSEGETAPEITSSGEAALSPEVAGSKPSEEFAFTREYELAAETEAAMNSRARAGTRMTQAEPINSEGYSILASTDDSGGPETLDITM